jgi:hypothetical protein
MSVINLGKAARAAALTIILAGSGLAATPAQAWHMGKSHSGAQVELEFQFGAPGFRFGFGDHDGRFCDLMSIRQVRRDLRSRGYHDIVFVDRRGRIVQAEAERNNKDYLITYDRCRGRIVDRDRI